MSAFCLPFRWMSTSCEGDISSCSLVPASSVTFMEMSCPERWPGFRTGGVMREASGTSDVFGAHPRLLVDVGVPGMKRGPTTIGNANW